MNNEMMMPLMVYLLQSEDSKKQADRVIQEVKANGIKEFAPGKEVNKDFMPIMSYLSSNIDKIMEDSKTQANRVIQAVETKEFTPSADATKKYNEMLLIWTDLSNSITSLREDIKTLSEKLAGKESESFVNS
ncbi:MULTISPECIES: hypothetical protein [Niastella]|uniref:Uncharacterized protein n=1 Tax=Niastella soli TaxID=2821487 RepID=A0ABS3Z5N6_9BACT|nr:hypothetical protein [Niastella soli]MBO9205458.1 hypothetical protein [Niastella soli]